MEEQTIKELKLELRKLNNNLTQFAKKRKSIVNRIQKKCKHLRVEKSGGGMWHEWPEYGYNDTYYSCLDCKKVWNLDKLGWGETEMLEKNIVKDTSI
jgi:hypothetical protein